MNNAKMWLVVSPSVGVPIFLGAVAVGSFAVHVAVLSNTSWVDDFLQGQPMGTGDATAALQQAADPDVARVSYALPTADGTEVLVVMPDGTTAKAILQSPDVLASATQTY